MSDDLVKVAVRIRPLIQSEIDKGCQTCLKVIAEEQQIQIQPTEKFFTFNYVFPAESSQEEFYNTAIKNMVLNIFEGTRSLLFILVKIISFTNREFISLIS
jgi:kinesin family protein 4/21/27